ncbi:hypothetical protein JYT89_04255, partial [Flavobacteriaceae bacterium AH-315-B10]|nr:hypothetical protein [Flavobacteriaceae bacterium AH-315-B10]
MEQNKSGKYLKYAIGEVLLVVIGILLALQINNWNNKVQDAKLSILYYQELLLDVENDLEQLNDRINYSERVTNSIYSLIEALQNKTYAIVTQDTLQYAMNHYYRVSGWQFNLNTYKELESSGNLRYIENSEIRSAITDYVNSIEGSAIVRERYTEDIVSRAFYIDKYVFTKFNHNNELVSIIDFEGLANDQHLINYFSRIAIRWVNNKLSFQKIDRQAKKIQETIISELEKLN